MPDTRPDPPPRVVDFAVAAAQLKQTTPGDFDLATVEEVERLLAGENPARVRR